MMSSGFGLGLGFMSIIFPVVFLTVFGVILFIIIKGISQWSYNNKQPVLSVNVKVISKRTNTSHSTNNMNNNFSSTTSYYVTFEVESSDRMEFHIPGHEYGLIAEGDIGKLTFQGTRFINFERYKV